MVELGDEPLEVHYTILSFCVCVFRNSYNQMCVKKNLDIWILTRVLELIFHILEFNDLVMAFFIVVK